MPVKRRDLIKYLGENGFWVIEHHYANSKKGKARHMSKGRGVKALERSKGLAIMVWVILISVLMVCQPAHSSDFSIVFISHRDGSKDVWIMDEDGSNLKNLTGKKKGEEEDPTVSPDGKQIAFSSDRGPNRQRWIFIMDADGRNQKNITDGSGEGFPVWSPDGTKIAYTGLAGNSLSIYIIDIASWTRKQE